MLKNLPIVAVVAVVILAVTACPKAPTTPLERANHDTSVSVPLVPPALAQAPPALPQAADSPELGTLANPRHSPDPTLTPGDALPVTKADICVSGYSHKVRNVPTAVRAEVWSRYNLPSQHGRAWEVDHLIPLELGGSNRLVNLWPEPGNGPASYHDKDKLENTLRGDVCSDQMPLADAQRAIAQDWQAAYAQYVEGN